MKKWSKPEIQKLDVLLTQHGQTVTEHVDDVITYNGYKFFSFS